MLRAFCVLLCAILWAVLLRVFWRVGYCKIVLAISFRLFYYEEDFSFKNTDFVQIQEIRYELTTLGKGSS